MSHHHETEKDINISKAFARIGCMCKVDRDIILRHTRGFMPSTDESMRPDPLLHEIMDRYELSTLSVSMLTSRGLESMIGLRMIAAAIEYAKTVDAGEELTKCASRTDAVP